MKEAPEGIVAYSWSGVVPTLYDDSAVPISEPVSIDSLVNRSGVIYVGTRAYIDFTDKYGVKYKDNEKLVLSSGLIETLDLISEGEIDGPLSGNYIYSGNIGQTGWSSVTFSGYNVPSGYESLSWLRSIYWNKVPVLSDIAQFNFQSVDVGYSLGTQDGSNIQSIISEETVSRTLGERLYGGTDKSKIYRILNPDCKGVIINIKVPSLSETDPKNGNIGRTRIEWNVCYRPIFLNFVSKISFSSPIFKVIWGKVTSAGGYLSSTRIDFNTNSFISRSEVVKQVTTESNESRSRHPTPPQITYETVSTDTPINIGNFSTNPNFVGWEIQVTRTTQDAVTSMIQNATVMDSITELYGSSLTYPCSALVKSTFNAAFFSSVPERAFECKLLKVNIPGNYDPITKTYATNGFATTNGYWDGTFATGKYWTDNPAWCYYDLVTNKRYGLGKFINNLSVDRFTLYKIGQYCDELVADGYGGLEPRFTCNTWVSSREEAFKVINDFASVFRGMLYYAHGSVYAVQDSPKEPRVLFTNANVENGDFNYSSVSKKVRHSIAVVRYNDPKNFYQPAIEYVEDVNSIRKYGIKELNLTAFACTSRGQAIRFGNWALLSNNLETETVRFVGGLEVSSLMPGDIFKVFDVNKKWKRYGGRIWNITNYLQAGNPTGALVTLDSTINLESGIQYKLSALTPSYFYDSTQITGLTDGDYSDIRRPFIQQFFFSGDNAYVLNNKSVIPLLTGFNYTDYNISGNPAYIIELGPNSQSYSGSRYFIDSSEDYYRTLAISEKDSNKFEVIGVQYYPLKFSQIDSGITYQSQSLSNVNRVPSSPHDLSLALYELTQSRRLIQYAFLVDDYKFINGYKVFVNTGAFGAGIPDASLLTIILPSDILQGSYLPAYSGNYYFRVYSYNENDNIYSNGYAQGNISVNTDLSIRDVIINGLQLA